VPPDSAAAAPSDAAALEAAANPPAAPPEITPEARALAIEHARLALIRFTDDTTRTLVHTRPALPAGERTGLHLYFTGAAMAAAEQHKLDDATMRVLAQTMLERNRSGVQDIANFFAELEIAGERPRYRRMLDDGKVAIGALLGNPPQTPPPPINEILARWSDPGQRGAEPQQMTFLLTDIVGSTALTSQIGNAGAQRVVRAHNTIVRAAAKAFRGREVKHTGDGMLLIFPDSTSGARAAVDIQQEATGFAKDNPTAPLAMRVGVHTGEAVFEDGEYYGPAVAIVSGICAMVDAAEICCSATVRQKVPAVIRFEEMGAHKVKGAASPIDLVKLLWEPKRSATKTVLEYRQIGTTPNSGVLAPPSEPQ
jgi:adenylate cyclase